MVLLDSNILIGLLNLSSPEHQQVVSAVSLLERSGRTLVLCLQTLAESWNVITRPASSAHGRPGLGWPFPAAQKSRDWLLQRFVAIPESPDLLRQWMNLVDQHQIAGVSVHDCRLVAFMRSHGISSLLTYNSKDFRRYSAITAATPAEALAGAHLP